MAETSTEAHTPLVRRIAALPRPRWVRNAWFVTRYAMGSTPLTLPLLRFAPSPHANTLIDAQSGVCIEGLPRSANTFGDLAFMRRNPDVRVAHHMHVPYQFQKAVRLGIPTAVLIREPIGNLTSMIIAGEGQVSATLVFRSYLHYFRQIAKVRDDIVLCAFDEVLAQPSIIATRLNERFGTAFDDSALTDQEKQDIVDMLAASEGEGSSPGHVPVPNEFKERLKPQVREMLRSHKLLPDAQRAYEEAAATILR